MNQEDEPTPGLADNMRLRESPFFSSSAAVAQIGDHDVCWCCHDPVIIHGSFVDVPMGDTYVRICKKKKCGEALVEEVRMSTDGKTIST